MTTPRILDAMINLQAVITASDSRFFWIGKPDAPDTDPHGVGLLDLQGNLERQGVSSHARLSIHAAVTSLTQIMHGFDINGFTLELDTNTAVRCKLAVCGYVICALSPDDPVSDDFVVALQIFEIAMAQLRDDKDAGDLIEYEVSHTIEDEPPDENGEMHIFYTQVPARSPRAAAALLSHIHAVSRHYTEDDDIHRSLDQVRSVSFKYSPETWAPHIPR